jgi:hypothetical protein
MSCPGLKHGVAMGNRETPFRDSAVWRSFTRDAGEGWDGVFGEREIPRLPAPTPTLPRKRGREPEGPQAGREAGEHRFVLCGVS